MRTYRVSSHWSRESPTNFSPFKWVITVYGLHSSCAGATTWGVGCLWWIVIISGEFWMHQLALEKGIFIFTETRMRAMTRPVAGQSQPLLALKYQGVVMWHGLPCTQHYLKIERKKKTRVRIWSSSYHIVKSVRWVLLLLHLTPLLQRFRNARKNPN